MELKMEMFLSVLSFIFDCIICIGCTIDKFLAWIESRSVFIEIVTAIIIGYWGFQAYFKQKRLDAYLGYYSKLRVSINSVKSLLENNNLLNSSDDNAGNIFLLLYHDDIISHNYSEFHIPSDKLIVQLCERTNTLAETIYQCDNNFAPKRVDPKVWNSNLKVLYEFCVFIKDIRNKRWETTNIQDDNNGKRKHRTKCDELNDSFTFIITTIDKHRCVL